MSKRTVALPTVRTVLELARELVGKQRVTHTPAIADDRAAVSPISDHACGWCAIGAVDRAAFDLRAGRDIRNKAMEALEDALPRKHPALKGFNGERGGAGGWSAVAYFNDSSAISLQDVLDLYTSAIEREKR